MRNLELCNKNQVKPFQPDLMPFPMGWGGRRDGAGSPKRCKSVVVRIPADLLEDVNKLKALHAAGCAVIVANGGKL